jgi:calcium release-activated calcium channel protein 1
MNCDNDRDCGNKESIPNIFMRAQEQNSNSNSNNNNFLNKDSISDYATAFLTALDTSLAKKWREEDREWRKQDCSFRKEEREYKIVEQLYREQSNNWRKADMNQRTLENARVVWNRYVEKNRRDVEEKSEQLRAQSNLAALIAGFAVVSLVELNFTNDYEQLPKHVSEWLIALYASTTALVVGLMLNSMVLCTFLLSSILKRGKSYVSEDEEAEFLTRCRKFAHHYKPGDYPPQPKRTFERHWENRCEDSWRKAFFMFTFGVPVFLINLACCAWLKFAYSSITSGLVSFIVFISAIVWAKTNKDWGWEIARGSNSQGKTSHKNAPYTKSFSTGKANGLPFDWHAQRPTFYDDEDEDFYTNGNNADADADADSVQEEEEEEEEVEEGEGEESEDEGDDDDDEKAKSDDSALERRRRRRREKKANHAVVVEELDLDSEKDERVFVPIHDST